VTSGSRLVGGVQEREPLLGMDSLMQAMGRTLVEGPRRRTREMGPVDVGCQVMVKGTPAGTIWLRPAGREGGLVSGGLEGRGGGLEGWGGLSCALERDGWMDWRGDLRAPIGFPTFLPEGACLQADARLRAAESTIEIEERIFRWSR